MKHFGTDEYGNKNGFKIICQNCGKEAWIVPTHYMNKGKVEKITLEIRCTCGNKYGATIHS